MLLRKSWLIALTLVTFALLAGSALWAGDGATYVSDTIPSYMVAGTTYSATVTMRNSGDTTWVDGGTPDYNFGSWDAPPGPNQSQNWAGRADVGGPIAANATKTFTLSITPPTGGVYDTTWGMVHEGVAWFGDVVHKTVTVVGGPLTRTIQRGAFGTVIDTQATRGGSGPSGDPPLANQFDYNWQTFSSAPWNLTSGMTPGYAGGGYPDNVLDSNGVSPTVRLYPDVNGSRCCPGNHTMFKFDLSFIPAGSVIDSATFGLSIYKSGSPATYINYNLSPFAAGRDWIEGPGDGAPNDVFQKFWAIGDSRNVPWGVWGATKATGPNQDIDGTRTVGGIDTDMISAGAVNVTSLVDAWVNGGLPNNGMLLWGGDGITPTGTSRWETYMSDTTNVNQRPKLTVTWHNNAPTVTAPIGDVWIASTATPTITWISNAGATVTNHQVRVCTVDNQDGIGGSIAYDSGTIAGNAVSAVSGTLANGNYWAFVREQTAGGWTLWSSGAPIGNGGFHISMNPPAAPVMTSPTGTSASPKVTIAWTGDVHAAFQAKVFTSDVSNPETATAVFDSTVVTSNAFSCPASLLPNGSYYAFAKLQNAAGWSAWSTGRSFTVARADWTDVLLMDETVPDLLAWDNPGGTIAWTGTTLTSPDRQDGFAHEMLGNDTTYSIGLESGACGAISSNKLLVVENPNPGGASGAHDRSLRMHKCWEEIDLDRGVTLAWEIACENEQKGSIHGGKPLVCASVMLSDKGPDGFNHGVSVRCRANSIGIVSNQLDATTSQAEPGGFILQGLPSSPEFRRYRLTGRNQVAGDYSSTQWKLYLNDTLVLSSTGTFVDPDNPTYACDFYALGIGETNVHGKWSFDWTGINGGGDYAPGEWEPVPASASTFANIGAAKKGLVGSRSVTINGSMVITKVVSHLDIGPDQTPGTEDDTNVQDYYYVQDLTNGLLGQGARVVTADTQSGAVAVGKQVSHLSGVFAEQGGCRSITNPSVTIDSADAIAIQGTAMSQKTLMGPCVSQGLGSNMDTSGMLVRVYGRVPTAPGFVGSDVFPPSGAYVVYIDDGSGAIDGRESADGTPYPGIRVLIDASSLNPVVPSYNDYVMLEGIAGYEDITTGAYATVRQIMHPTISILASGI
jgi:hypothetical protein